MSTSQHKVPNRWWEGRPDEIYWFETTDRADLGRDLNAPQFGEEGKPNWSYEFVNEVAEGDVVLHYNARPKKALLGWSRVVGRPYADDVVWGAHGAASGRGPVMPYRRPGWRVGLDGPYFLDSAISLEQLRELESDLRSVRDNLARDVGGPLYFPFAFSPSRPLRPTQFYLTKAPRALLLAVPQLADVERTARETASSPARPAPLATAPGLGVPYRREDESAATAERDPFSVDPSVVDRGLRGHAMTQNALANYLQSINLEPRSSEPGEPTYDLAWENGNRLTVAEIKSVTTANEEKQLRLGLGQVLRYAQQLEQKREAVDAVLAIEREPSDPSWSELCRRLGVTLVWPGTFDRLNAV